MATYSENARTNIGALATAYAAAMGTTIGAVSKKFYGNAGFIAAFIDGRRSASLKTIDEMMAKFQEHWPEGVDPPHLNTKISPGTFGKPMAKSGQIT